MKVDIRDVTAMQSLRPLEVAAYLRARSWTQQTLTPHASVWVKGEADEQMEAVVPMDTKRRDFALRMGELHLPPTGQEFDAEPPYERKVTQMLATSLATLDQVSATAAMNQDFSDFERSVNEGVSANLCDAVARLWGDDDRNQNLQFTFSWSPARPVADRTPCRISFGSDRIPIIREASRVMRERSPYEDYELDGAVVELERAKGHPTGKVTIIGAIDGKPHRVSLELADPHYSLAIQAHHQQQPIHCVGTLVKSGRGYTLRDARQVSAENE